MESNVYEKELREKSDMKLYIGHYSYDSTAKRSL